MASTLDEVRERLRTTHERLESVRKFNAYHGEHGHFASHASHPVTSMTRDQGAIQHISNGGESTWSEGVAAKAKQGIVGEVTRRVMSNPDDAKVVAAMHSQMHAAGVPDEERVTYAVNRAVKGWALESADSDPDSLVMQRAVAEEFGLKDAHAHVMEHVSQSDKDEVDSRYSVDGPGSRIIARHIYANTQEQLEKAGITHVTLHRGVHFRAAELPEWGQDTVLHKAKVQSNPISSWSAQTSVAYEFATRDVTSRARILSATFPASRIFSTARTGFGCLSEEEFVVLDGPGALGVKKVAR